MPINSFPLNWPIGWKRSTSRSRARFSTRDYQTRPSRELRVSDGVDRVLRELDRMGYTRDDVVISTNVAVRLDGLPRSNQPEPIDSGAAVYWRTSAGENKVMAIDIYDRVADNLAAIAATLDAMRAIERHGGATILSRAFAGFVALPAPGAPREWWEVLGIPRDATRDQVRAAYRKLASANHPDRPGGSHEKMTELNQANEAAMMSCAA